MVIGEDLGTVTAELRKALNDAGVLSYRPLFFEKDAGGGFSPPEAYPREALTCVSTHDLPTWRGFWAGHDLKLREQFGLTVDPRKEREQREVEKEKLKRALERHGFDTSAAGAHAFLARTPSKLADGAARGRVRARRAGEPPRHGRRASELAPQAAREPRALEIRSPGAAARRQHGGTFGGKRRSPSASGPKRVPVATYRLQLHKGFRFTDATALVPYLARLGVSHVYASPFLKARPGSMHGYDIVDHGKINPEIGTEADLRRLLDALRRHGMGLVMDIVPNHMGVLHGDNPWWQDVLAKGRASQYAKFFDIDWQRGGGRLLLPVLGRHYGEALEEGEIKLVREGKSGPWRVAYYDQRFPLNSKSQKNLKPLKDPLALHRLLEKQHYRLAFWRVASDEINYRRFFEITDLAALRQEDKAVFEATHALIRELAARAGRRRPAHRPSGRACRTPSSTSSACRRLPSGPGSWSRRSSPITRRCRPTGRCTARPATASPTC